MAITTTAPAPTSVPYAKDRVLVQGSDWRERRNTSLRTVIQHMYNICPPFSPIHRRLIALKEDQNWQLLREPMNPSILLLKDLARTTIVIELNFRWAVCMPWRYVNTHALPPEQETVTATVQIALPWLSVTMEQVVSAHSSGGVDSLKYFVLKYMFRAGGILRLAYVSRPRYVCRDHIRPFCLEP